MQQILTRFSSHFFSNTLVFAHEFGNMENTCIFRFPFDSFVAPPTRDSDSAFVPNSFHRLWATFANILHMLHISAFSSLFTRRCSVCGSTHCKNVCVCVPTMGIIYAVSRLPTRCFLCFTLLGLWVFF